MAGRGVRPGDRRSLIDVEIRPGRRSDADELLPLIRQHAQFERTVATIGEDALATFLESPSSPIRILVATIEGTVVGYAALTFDTSLFHGDRWAHLECLFVATLQRNEGVGKRLLEHARAQAVAAGATRMEWQTPAWNSRAIAFYEREGAIGTAKMRFSLKA